MIHNRNCYPFTAPQMTVNGEGKIEFLFTSPDDTAFFRLRAEEGDRFPFPIRQFCAVWGIR
jgi:hypothetical protein